MKKKETKNVVTYDEEGIKGLHILACIVWIVIFALQFIKIMKIEITEIITEFAFSMWDIYTENGLIFFLNITSLLSIAICPTCYFLREKLKPIRRYRGYRLAKAGIIIELLLYLMNITITKYAIDEQTQAGIGLSINAFGHLYWILLVVLFLFFIPLSTHAATKRIEIAYKIAQDNQGQEIEKCSENLKEETK